MMYNPITNRFQMESYHTCIDAYVVEVVFREMSSNDAHSWFCAYVTVPNDHPFYGLDGEEVDRRIHRQIDTSYNRDGKFGFDTAHPEMYDLSLEEVVEMAHTFYRQLRSEGNE